MDPLGGREHRNVADLVRTVNLCTLFDKNYIAKGLALLGSIYDHVDRSLNMRVYVLAMDDETEKAVQVFTSDKVRKRISIWTIPHRVLVANQPRLTAARHDRSYVEYLWTLPSSLCLFCMKLWSLDDIAYIDADCCFFNSVRLLYEEIEADVCITPHRWAPEHRERLSVNGTYNVAWIYFHGDKGMECLTTWRNQVLQWCKKQNEDDGKYADQGYLEDWPETWGAQVIDHLGVNLAPWSQEQYQYAMHDGEMYVEGYPIVFYHFHEFKERKDGTFYWTGYPVDKFLARHLYPEYERRYRDAKQLGG